MITSEQSFIVHAVNTEQENALKTFFQAFGVKFETTKKSPYNQEFVDKIQKSRQDYTEGKGRVVTMDELNRLWK